MKLKFNQPLVDDEGKPVEEGTFKTLKAACCGVLYATIKGDDGLTGEKKGEMAFLALRIAHSVEEDKELEVKAEHITLLKERLGKAAPPLFVLQCHRLLEGKPALPTKEELGGS